MMGLYDMVPKRAVPRDAEIAGFHAGRDGRRRRRQVREVRPAMARFTVPLHKLAGTELPALGRAFNQFGLAYAGVNSQHPAQTRLSFIEEYR